MGPFTLHTLYNQLIPNKARFSALFSTTYITAPTPDITTLLVTGSNMIFQKVGYFEYSTLSYLRKQPLYSSR